MKKIIAISFLIVLCVSQFSYYFIYQFQLRQIKREMKAQLFAKLPESSLEIIVAEETKNIQWQDDGKEFSLNGEMFDVTKIKKENGKTVLYCINDKKEKELLQNFAKAMKADAANGKSGKLGIKFQFTDYIITSVEKPGGQISRIGTKFTVYNSALSFTIKEITAPPPRA